MPVSIVKNYMENLLVMNKQGRYIVELQQNRYEDYKICKMFYSKEKAEGFALNLSLKVKNGKVRVRRNIQ